MSDITRTYLKALEAGSYEGEIFTDAASRLINATDNSIYQLMPQAVLAPRTAEDLDIIMELGARSEFQDVCFMPRGGGTGTNGQSLGDCITIDTGKHLNHITEINAGEGWVRVQPGVVLDQLNAALRPHGLFFPAHVSPSKSATLGGMAATDACGKGSRIYGKTSDYVLDMECVLADGRRINAQDFEDPALRDLIAEDYEAAAASLPNLPRGISGYNLRAYDPAAGMLSMSALLAGSEGSLALIKELKLRVIPRPQRRAMVCIAYESFDAALRHAPALLEHDPAAIETIDDHILALARGDVLWEAVQNILPAGLKSDTIGAMHFVEFESESRGELDSKIETFRTLMESEKTPLGFNVLKEAKTIEKTSALRSKCVGLLGNMAGVRRPIPFMEDTAVPPENLANYIAELQAMLKSYGLECGAFGHVDAGCVHVRPALDMRLPEDEAMIRTLSDQTVSIVQKYGGVLWGEHGKGMRAEYTATLLGTPYYALMQKIKAHLDPHNKLNPGKIAAPPGEALRKIDEVPLRGHHDRQIGEHALTGFEKSIQCNGNGQCFSAMPDDVMCPSYKVTRDRRHSPKGRAGLLREWLRLKSTQPAAAKAFEPQLYEAMHGCLSCKACTSVCPVHVNIPDMKAIFLAQYFQKRLRSLRDYLIAGAELFAHWQSRLPLPSWNMFGLIDTPRRARTSLRKLMNHHNFSFADADKIAAAKNPVLIIQDAYTSTYDPQVVIAALSLLRKLGFDPLVLPWRQSGKSWHVMGFLQSFEKIRARNAAYYKSFDVPLIGLDPSMTLIYRDEYKDADLKVHLLQEWLAGYIPQKQSDEEQSYKLFLHCTEATMLPGAAAQWQSLFAALGVSVEPIQTGCCGMAGAYGHMKEHAENSRKLYEMSWKDEIDETALVTGYSCRSQIKRCDHKITRHPVQLLDDLF